MYLFTTKPKFFTISHSTTGPYFSNKGFTSVALVPSGRLPTNILNVPALLKPGIV